MDKGIVSVIVPIYNAEKFIMKCVDSIINQTYKNLEIILVDDGSTDNSPLLCDEYARKDKRVHVFHKDNGGPSSARNLALDNMNGEYVCFIDSDDYIELDMIEIMLNELISSNADDAICLEQRDDEENFKGDIYRNILEDKIGSQMWRHLFRANKFDGVYFPLNRFAEDMAILDRVLYNSKIVFVNKRLYNYYFNNQENVSNNSQNKFKNIIDRAIAFSDRYEWAKDKSNICDETKRVLLCKTIPFIISTFWRCEKYPCSNEDLYKLRQFLKANYKEIVRTKEINRKTKLVIKFILLSQKIFCFVGRLIAK